MTGPGDMQQTQHREREAAPTGDQTGAVLTFSRPDQRNSGRDQCDWYDEPTETGEESEQIRHEAAEDAGDLEVRRQADEQAAEDECNADEFVFAPSDGLA